MYLDFWGLREKPFENTPDPRFLYCSPQHEEALSRLLYVIEESKGAGMLSGVFGCGKTLIARALQARLSTEQYRVASLPIPPRRISDLFRSIVRHLKNVRLPVNETELSTDALIESLEYILDENAREGKGTVIVVDEAHAIDSDEVFEGLRLLLNFQDTNRFKLTLLLLGQPELWAKIDGNKPLEQRIAVKAQLGPLSFDELETYVSFRLEVAGSHRTDIFSAEALRLVHDNSGGIPRRINRLCDMSLLAGFLKRSGRIDRDIIQEEIHGIARQAG